MQTGALVQEQMTTSRSKDAPSALRMLAFHGRAHNAAHNCMMSEVSSFHGRTVWLVGICYGVRLQLQ
jgi:hypothetical protein